MTWCKKAALTLSIMVALLASAAPFAAAAKPSYWDIPYPFANATAGKKDWSGTTVDGPQRRLDAAAGAGSLYQLRKLKWSTWGKKQVVARGIVRYCDDECTPWSKAKLVLKRKRGLICGDADAPTQFNYRRYAVFGFPFDEDGATFRSAVVC